ncbi:helix-turn-helix transcriptional regulator [Amycolatopsis sp. NPDC088138]|uniref:helix-turn-helix transcriptional regulator n=1 Tax=Amycolatopsis sp. NPDC088138 TaxID=3363938 RepID=UPI0037FC2111
MAGSRTTSSLPGTRHRPCAETLRRFGAADHRWGPDPGGHPDLPVPQVTIEPSDELAILTALNPRTRFEIGAGRHTVAFGFRQPRLLPPRAAAFACAFARTEPVKVGSVALSRQAVVNTAAETAGLPRSGLAFDWERTPAPDPCRRWLTTVDYVRQTVLGNPATAANPIILSGATRLLATTMLTTFTHSGLDDDTRPEPGPAPAAVRRAIAFIETHAQSPITITDIADAARIGTRALNYAFRRHRATTPTAYLRRVRLDHAHRDLRDADPAVGDTVAAIAARWGFPHTARFAAVYRETYGVTPNTTLRP